MMCPKYRRYFTPISILDSVIDNRSYSSTLMKCSQARTCVSCEAVTMITSSMYTCK